jgi:hypothetical protein
MHTFQVVEGRVTKVAQYRKTTYINFGRRWRTDFTLIVKGRSHRYLKKHGLDLTSLKGRRVRVRGWIEERNGPMIRLTHPEQIEILDTGKATPFLGSGALEAFDRRRDGAERQHTFGRERPTRRRTATRKPEGPSHSIKQSGEDTDMLGKPGSTPAVRDVEYLSM